MRPRTLFLQESSKQPQQRQEMLKAADGVIHVTAIKQTPDGLTSAIVNSFRYGKRTVVLHQEGQYQKKKVERCSNSGKI